MHPRSEEIIDFNRILLHTFLYSWYSLTKTTKTNSVNAETCSALAAEHACLPLATGHGGPSAAAAEGGEIHSSSSSCGSDAHHQACGSWLCCWTVKSLQGYAYVRACMCNQSAASKDFIVEN